MARSIAASDIRAMRGRRIVFPNEFIKKPPWCGPGVALPALEGPALQPGVIVMKAFASERELAGVFEPESSSLVRRGLRGGIADEVSIRETGTNGTRDLGT